MKKFFILLLSVMATAASASQSDLREDQTQVSSKRTPTRRSSRVKPEVSKTIKKTSNSRKVTAHRDCEEKPIPAPLVPPTIPTIKPLFVKNSSSFNRADIEGVVEAIVRQGYFWSNEPRASEYLELLKQRYEHIKNIIGANDLCDFVSDVLAQAGKDVTPSE